jgi:hypothetical protein
VGESRRVGCCTINAMARVYLETSFISACVSTRTDAASVYRRDSSLDWMKQQSSLHELSVSAEVVKELDNPEYPQRAAALALAQALPLLAINDEVLGLAEILIRERVMPGPTAGDALHVAVATVHGIEFLLSWNVRHMANPNKLVHLQAVCVRTGHIPPRIVTPDLLWNRE